MLVHAYLGWMRPIWSGMFLIDRSTSKKQREQRQGVGVEGLEERKGKGKQNNGSE